MKLALLYTFWTGDDVDMLWASIKHHQPFVDKIILSIQETSNKGEYYPIQDGRIMNDWNLTEGVEIIAFSPDLSLKTKENERRKHDDMIEVAKQRGCTHFIMLAADHFYSEELMMLGKSIMKTTDHDLIVTKMKTYYKNFNWMLWPLEDYYAPFIHKLTINTAISKHAKYPVKTDPSVKVTTSQNVYIMPEMEGVMNHYSMIRTDIEKKFRNAAASVNWSSDQVEQFINEYKTADIGSDITYFQNRKIIVDADPLIMYI